MIFLKYYYLIRKISIIRIFLFCFRIFYFILEQFLSLNIVNTVRVVRYYGSVRESAERYQTAILSSNSHLNRAGVIRSIPQEVRSEENLLPLIIPRFCLAHPPFHPLVRSPTPPARRSNVRSSPTAHWSLCGSRDSRVPELGRRMFVD